MEIIVIYDIILTFESLKEIIYLYDNVPWI